MKLIMQVIESLHDRSHLKVDQCIELLKIAREMLQFPQNT